MHVGGPVRARSVGVQVEDLRVLPDVGDLQEVLNELKTISGVRLNLTPLGKEKLVKAAIGLTRSQAHRVFAKAIVSDGVLDDKDIDLVTEEKKQIIRESEEHPGRRIRATAEKN